MNRKSLTTRLIATAVFALASSGAAFADDSSMNILTGDSYAYFNNLDFNLARQNTARAPAAQEQTRVAVSPVKQPAEARRPVMIAKSMPRGRVGDVFRDDTGN